jgi:hypothetical protein
MSDKLLTLFKLLSTKYGSLVFIISALYFLLAISDISFSELEFTNFLDLIDSKTDDLLSKSLIIDFSILLDTFSSYILYKISY